MKAKITIFFYLCSFYSSAQSIVQGIVEDEKGQPIFAVNIYEKSNPTKGVISDFDGTFKLQVSSSSDTLVVSFIGYQTIETLIETIDTPKELIFVLKEKNRSIEAITITAKDPISEQFSVVKMSILKDVYLNPVSQGDPLKAISILPSSTNTDETANPSLRGSSPDRSRVILNGVPIYKPVRASLLNNQGFFSLFNPEIIDNQYVYASNPPLTYGNTSAGLIEIQTLRKLEKDQLQLSASLASTGFFISKNLKRDISFIQLYGNYQFSDAYVGIQLDKLPRIENFYTSDAGINFHSKMRKNIEVNSYNYFIDESFNGNSESFTYQGDVSTSNKRFFTVNNLKHYSNNSIFSINCGFNTSTQNFNFGNINSDQYTEQIYSSVDYKWHLLENTNLQFGIAHDYQNNSFSDTIPVFFYALSPKSPVNISKSVINNHSLEAYFYCKWDINDKAILTSGTRTNLPIRNQSNYWSSQLGIRYKLNSNQSFLLSGGKYHNYSLPNFFSKRVMLLSSLQIAFDYSFELKNTMVKAAAYYKNETGQQPLNELINTDKTKTFGLEVYLEKRFLKYFKCTFSNVFLDQKLKIGDKEYRGFRDFNYYLKSSIQFNHPRLFYLGITYMGRPGTSYTDISGSKFDLHAQAYEPIFNEDLYSGQFGNYNRFDISLSRYWRIQNNGFIAFFSMNNILNSKNQSEALYNDDYTLKSFDFFQLRTLYFGLVWQFDY